MHYIAYYYKWGLEEIYTLSLKKRQKWLNLIAEQIKAESAATDKDSLQGG